MSSIITWPYSPTSKYPWDILQTKKLHKILFAGNPLCQFQPKQKETQHEWVSGKRCTTLVHQSLFTIIRQMKKNSMPTVWLWKERLSEMM
jgi:hypothetical protein